MSLSELTSRVSIRVPRARGAIDRRIACLGLGLGMLLGVSYLTLRGTPGTEPIATESSVSDLATIANEETEASSAPAFEREALTTAPSRGPASGSSSRSDESTDPAFRPGALLPFIAWDYERHAGSVARVMAHPLLNPAGVKLSAEDSKELKALIDRLGRSIREAERAMSERRLRFARERIEKGMLSPARRDSNGALIKPTSSDPELEVALCGRGDTAYELLVAWGDDPEYDRSRLTVFQVKQDAVGSLTSFMSSRAR